MLAALVAALGSASAYYLPGLAPKDFSVGEEVPVLVNRLTSEGGGDIQGSVMGYDYYNPHLKFCEPEGGKKSVGGSLGAIFFGDRLYTSPYKLEVLKDQDCNFVCETTYNAQDHEFMTRKIAMNFYHYWLIDGLPVFGREKSTSDNDDNVQYQNGFPLGAIINSENENSDIYALFNHHEITVEYHQTADGKIRIVGATVIPHSINNKNIPDFKCDQTSDHVEMRPDDLNEIKVVFSYSVKWVASETSWATRWDKYLKPAESRVSWFGLTNTMLLVFFTLVFAALTLTRMVRKDIARYNEIDLANDDIPEEHGWKIVHGDVFRPPRGTMYLAICIGSGAQVLATFAVTLFLAVLGFLSPANRGAFPTVLLLSNFLGGAISGYVSARVYKTWGGQRWKTNLLFTPTILPMIIFGMFICINFLLVLSQASGAVPVGQIVELVAIWGLIGVPLSLGAGFYALKKKVPEPPVRVNQIPRQIPPKKWYYRTPVFMLIGGILPFATISLQLHYIMTAIWFQRIYYMFGFLFVSVAALVLLTVIISLLALYYSLCAEDYRWQWRVFFVAGSPAVYVWIYTLYYLVHYMNLAYTSGKLLYIGYCSLASFLCFLALGCAGSLASHSFLRYIYASIKTD